jgi:3,4-dihydroxy-2-butanone 4-phosphate synthase
MQSLLAAVEAAAQITLHQAAAAEAAVDLFQVGFQHPQVVLSELVELELQAAAQLKMADIVYIQI